MLKRFVKLVGGNPNQREIDNLSHYVDEINELEKEYETLSDDEISAKTDIFRERLNQGETLNDLLVEAFATVREASKRTIGLRHYDVQLIGGVILHQGKIVEMKTGEGKTLVATLPIYLNALTGGGVHLITVNDYLARRDARWMAPIYSLLRLKVGVLQMAARTENGKKAFIVDLNYESPHEDQHQLIMVPRNEAYNADITYGTNSEFGFDYLRDNMTMRWENRVQRIHTYAIIDEVDNVLIDEARTPLIISGPAQDEAEWYIRMAQIVKSLRPEDFEVNEKNRNVTLTEVGEMHVEQLLGMTLRDPDRPEDITPQQARTLGYLEQALRAQHLFNRNKEYLIQAGKVVIIDEFTGRLMPGRRWSDGLHQAVEAKEGVKVQSESVTYATITIQNYFRMYEKLAGMTGTAVTEAEEFDKIYKLQVLALPTNLEYQASRPDSELEEIESRDRSGYKYLFYTTSKDANKTPIFWKRKDYPDVVYRTQEAKLRALIKEILRYNVLGRPLLVGTTSVESSELLSRRLSAEPIRRLSQVILLRNTWLEHNNRVDDGRVIDELQFLNVPLEQLQISDMRKLARDVEMSFNPEEEKNLLNLMSILDIPPENVDRLIKDLQAGIPHQVLNARKHTEESQVIAGAGAFGAVTIATNMAGRGVDIKLGGEMAEEVISAVNRVLRRAGYNDAFEMTIEERKKALIDLDPTDHGIYGSEINYFLQHVQEMGMVRELGGLHVIGSERHEARRIDNQLRGRSSRQGDPGSSRFYLSMEDELMRLFGGGQADSLMQRMRIDDAMPLEAGLVSRIVEQAQSRVEGANFDVRKHLLEYDDVLNTQRSKIYEQRNRIFVKDDLTEDVTDMLVTEVSRRIPEYLADDETDNSWKLLGWLNQIQPPIIGEEFIYPSYTLQLIYEEIEKKGLDNLNQSQALAIFVEVANKSIDAEYNYILDAVEMLLDSTQKNLDQNLTERMEALDIFIDGLVLEEEDERRDGNELIEDLVSLVRAPIRLSARQQKDLIEDPEAVIEDIRTQVEQIMLTQSITRLIGSIERRLEEPIEIENLEFSSENWTTITERIIESIKETFNKRKLRYIGEQNSENVFTGGLITKDLEKALSQINGAITRDDIFRLLILMPQGTKATFDKKTHRRVLLRTTRLNFVYYASNLLNKNSITELSNEVLEHLNGAQSALRELWGYVEWNRVASSRFEDLNEITKNKLRNELGGEFINQNLNQAIGAINGQAKNQIIFTLGNLSLTEIYRQLLLSVITELWVEYLTQMEGLRVSIGLEAYAQRDPLVQYKNRAFELYQELLSNVRLSVINRMFTYQPRAGTQSRIVGNTQPETEDEIPVQEQENRVLEMTSIKAKSTADHVKQQKESSKGLSSSQKRRRKRKK